MAFSVYLFCRTYIIFFDMISTSNDLHHSKGSVHHLDHILNEDAAIYFEHVSYKRDNNTILSHINGMFPKGKITALVGPSGAGKTSLLKLCNGLKSPTSGNIYINNKNINSYDPPSLRRYAGIALQQATMIDGTVRKNLALPLTLQNKSLTENEAKELLKLVGLESDMLSRHVNDLSGGQKQKLSIARTLVNRPHILLLDEITSSLDPISVEEIEKLIYTINKKYRTTIIWITHDINQARQMGDYVWVMMQGQLIESGSISLLDHPKTDKVAQFLKGRSS